MKTLLTGGAGFIGSHLADRLLAEGHCVACVDDLSLGRRENISHNFGEARFKFIKADAADACALETVFKRNRFDCVFHLAANSDIRAGGDCPDIDLNRTFLTTYRVLEAMRKYGVKKLVFASTSAVYGEGGKAFGEDSGPLSPVSLYGAGKLACEAWINAFCANFGMQSWIIRFPNVVGPRATHGALFDFTNRLRENPRKLLILGNGRQKKPYLHVRDPVDGILFVFKRAKARINVYNAAGEGVTTVDEIARAAVSAAGLKNVRFSYPGGSRGWKGDVPRFRYDISKITRLGWKASMSSAAAVRAAARELHEETCGK